MDAQQPERAPIAPFVDIAALVGLAGIVAGAIVLGPTSLGFDPAKAFEALFSWIPVTLGPGLLVLAVSTVELAAGAAMARAVRGRPFDRLDEMLLQGFVFAVVKDVLLLGLLGGAGLFLQPILAMVDAAVILAGLLLLRPFAAPAVLRLEIGFSPLGLLLLVAWSAPILLQLASPVVPFLDVLPNHVAPAEHLRTFGTLSHLTDTQSPIYGPSRIFLGYTALLGSITTISGLPAGQAVAGFILPSTVLVAAAMWRLATAVGGRATAPWVLLAFAMTTSVARLGDARATVIVLPLAAWVLAVIADGLPARGAVPRRPNPPASSEGPPTGDASPGLRGPWLPAGVVVGLGLGAALLMHPVIGFLAAVSVTLVVVARPRVEGIAIPALGTGAVVALPQAATMLGVALPPIVLVLVVLVGVMVGLALASDASARIRTGFVLVGRGVALAAALIGLVFGGPVIRAGVAGADPLLSVMELSVMAAAAAAILWAPAARSPVVWASLAAGFVVAGLTQLVPATGAGLLGDALRFELPKTLQYWVPVFVALLAGAGLAAVAGWNRAPVVLRGVGLAAFVGAASLPIRSTPIDAFHLGEHRLSETFSIAMRWVQTGFWAGYPDSRYVVDAPRQELLDAVRAEIRAGRLGPDTGVLHVAGSFQQWVATPLGVFDGVTETDVVPDVEVSIHTVGGRLRPLADLPSLLSEGPPGGRTYGCVVLEPSDRLPTGTRDAIVAAGYVSIFANAQGELFGLRQGLK